jgi:hypothetical protein
MEELENLDQPRGVVAAANQHAGKVIELVPIINAARSTNDEDSKRIIMEAAEEAYKSVFDAFIAGAKWSQRLNLH